MWNSGEVNIEAVQTLVFSLVLRPFAGTIAKENDYPEVPLEDVTTLMKAIGFREHPLRPGVAVSEILSKHSESTIVKSFQTFSDYIFEHDYTFYGIQLMVLSYFMASTAAQRSLVMRHEMHVFAVNSFWRTAKGWRVIPGRTFDTALPYCHLVVRFVQA